MLLRPSTGSGNYFKEGNCGAGGFVASTALAPSSWTSTARISILLLDLTARCKRAASASNAIVSGRGGQESTALHFCVFKTRRCMSTPSGFRGDSSAFSFGRRMTHPPLSPDVVDPEPSGLSGYPPIPSVSEECSTWKNGSSTSRCKRRAVTFYLHQAYVV